MILPYLQGEEIEVLSMNLSSIPSIISIVALILGLNITIAIIAVNAVNAANAVNPPKNKVNLLKSTVKNLHLTTSIATTMQQYYKKVASSLLWIRNQPK
jgi:hypothetical protein